MSKKMNIPYLFKNKEAKQPWTWPLCTQPKTHSFRETNDQVFNTVNSMLLDLEQEQPDSLFTSSSHCPSFSTDELSEEINANDSLETIIQRIRLSDRLFFEPGDTSSILKDEKIYDSFDEKLLPPFKESIALALESDDPYLDFKKSMEEMVESHGLKDWECLEEMLGWYLKMNDKFNHGLIVEAFVDLVVGIFDLSNCDSTSKITHLCSTSYSSAASSLSSTSFM